jgi:hypothetical protein
MRLALAGAEFADGAGQAAPLMLWLRRSSARPGCRGGNSILPADYHGPGEDTGALAVSLAPRLVESALS